MYKQHKRATGLIVAGILATGAVGAVAMTPASATTSTNAVTSRLAGIKGALSGLVSDGTLTQSQVDKVAGTLDSKLPIRGPGGMHGPGGHLGRMGRGMGMGMARTEAAAAKALGLTTDKLHTALESGKSLADVAKDQKVSVSALVKAMVTAAEGQLATAVKDGALTQAEAARMKSSLTERITDHVNRVRPDHGARFGPGHGPGGADSSSPTGVTSGGTSSAPLGMV
jgi:hypothetical protein